MIFLLAAFLLSDPFESRSAEQGREWRSAERSAAWRDAAALAEGGNTADFLRGWTDVEALFTPAAAPAERPSHRGSIGNMPGDENRPFLDAGEPEIIISTYYNDIASDHVRTNGLATRTVLDDLRRTGSVDPSLPGNRTVPGFPGGAQIVMAAWWPAAANEMTPFPVWDAQGNSPSALGNNYLGWRRLVAVRLTGDDKPGSRGSVDFLGRNFRNVAVVAARDVRHIRLSAADADAMSRDPAKRKAAIIAMGRPLRHGDLLLLAGFHMATKRDGKWTWATFWWHDRAGAGDFSANRPPDSPPFLKNYLLDVAEDPADGAARPTFNPWFEARFPDQGAGSGVSSNCITCHARASYPKVGFLPVTKGPPAPTGDPAYAAGRLRTDFIWGIARRARD